MYFIYVQYFNVSSIEVYVKYAMENVNKKQSIKYER